MLDEEKTFCIKHPDKEEDHLTEKLEIPLEDGSVLKKVSTIGSVRVLRAGVSTSKEYIGIEVKEDLPQASIAHNFIIPARVGKTVNIGDAVEVWIRCF